MENLHNITKPVFDSSDYIVDIEESKYKEFENIMKDCHINFSILDELPLILKNPLNNY